MAKPCTPEDITNVVCIGIDGSPQAEHAFDWYMDHLHRDGNHLILIHAMEVAAMPTRESWEVQSKSGQTKWDELKDKYQTKFKQLGIIGKFISEHEKPGVLVCDIAKKENADYIVMGTRGLGKVRRTIMGSVSDYVIHHAGCPVMVCRYKEH